MCENSVPQTKQKKSYASCERHFIGRQRNSTCRRVNIDDKAQVLSLLDAKKNRITEEKRTRRDARLRTGREELRSAVFFFSFYHSLFTKKKSGALDDRARARARKNE